MKRADDALLRFPWDSDVSGPCRNDDERSITLPSKRRYLQGGEGLRISASLSAHRAI